MPLENNKSEAVRIKDKMNKIKYSNYLASQTRFTNGITNRPGQVIAGTGSSGEASALIDIREGIIVISPAEQAAIISENSAR
jgi:hypothetical protein